VRLFPFILVLTLSFSPFFVLAFLLNNSPALSTPTFRAKFGALYQHLKLHTISGYSYNFWFIARRAVYGASIGLLGGTPSMQLILQIIMSSGQLGYVLVYMPYEVYTDNLFDIVNEATVLLVMTMSCSFTAGNMDPLTASNFGFIVIGIICANIAVSLSIFIGSNL